MTVTIPIPNIKLTPGSQICISGVTWEDFEGILIDLGEKRTSRITYYQGNLEIMSPLAIHERPHRIIADIVKTILEIEGRDWEDFGATTLKHPQVAGIEPDTCFYIENAERVRNCTNLILADYPPPDLAIECDVTSKTTLDVYLVLGVPEVWIYRDRQLNIYVIDDNSVAGYRSTVNSPTFPNLSITEILPQLVQKAIESGTSQMLRELKAFLK
jgi:Uma2 family endonuclease